MEISVEKTKLMTNNTSGINTEFKVNGQKLETVTSFKYLGSVLTDEGSKPEILSRVAQTTAALIRLKPVWNYRSIPLSSKIRLMRSERGKKTRQTEEEMGRQHQGMDRLGVRGKEGRRQGRQRKRWEDNIKEWTGLEFAKSQRAVENRRKWRKLVAKSSVVP